MKETGKMDYLVTTPPPQVDVDLEMKAKQGAGYPPCLRLLRGRELEEQVVILKTQGQGRQGPWL